MNVSQRCSTCAINYPPTITPACPRCDTRLTPSAEPVTEGWKELALEVYGVRAESADEFPTVRGKLRQEGKQYLLGTHDVVNSGIHRRLRADEVLRIVDDEGAETYVEVLGYAYQGRVYLVRLFQVTWPVDKKGRAYIPKRWKRK